MIKDKKYASNICLQILQAKNRGFKQWIVSFDTNKVDDILDLQAVLWETFNYKSTVHLDRFGGYKTGMLKVMF